MSHTPHELADEFPQDHDVLHKLKMEDAHFQNLAEKYHALNREIHRIESEIEAASDEHAETLKKLISKHRPFYQRIRALVRMFVLGTCRHLVAGHANTSSPPKM